MLDEGVYAPVSDRRCGEHLEQLREPVPAPCAAGADIINAILARRTDQELVRPLPVGWEERRQGFS
jgi:hypothetical protein